MNSTLVKILQIKLQVWDERIFDPLTYGMGRFDGRSNSCILPQHSQKRCSGWRQKELLHCTISRRPRTLFSEHLENKCLYIHVNLRSKIFVSGT